MTRDQVVAWGVLMLAFTAFFVGFVAGRAATVGDVIVR